MARARGKKQKGCRREIRGLHFEIVFSCVGSPSSIETTETKNYRKIFAYLVRLVTEK